MDNKVFTRCFRYSGHPSFLPHILFMLVSGAILSQSSASTTESQLTPTASQHRCRDRQGDFPPDDFAIHACSWCLLYLQPNRTWPYKNVTVPSMGISVLLRVADGTFVVPAPQNETWMRTECEVSGLSKATCADWKACCRAAGQCCNKQQDRADVINGAHCPMTWDGYSCVDATPAGQTATISCPTFLRGKFHTDDDGTASKQCTKNATWFVSSNGLEWTDYHTCHKTVDQRVTLTLRLSLKGVSLALLIPSIAVFLVFRGLRSQVRIKLHINLFIALALTSLLSLIWEAIVSNDLLTEAHPESYIRDHQVSCKLLNIMSRCTLMMTFTWMFCEAFYLTWLMLRSFRHINTMVYFYLFGWGVPIFFTLVYVIIRTSAYEDNECWIMDAGKLEWVMDGPTVACMLMNFIFLVAIMRVMVRQLQSHQEDQSMLRRGLRALLILIPLFGLQEVFIIYRPQPDDPGFFAYDVASAIIMNLQGAVVALIFCFFNGEVQTHLKQLFVRLKCKLYRRTDSQPSFSTAPSTARLWRPSLASIDTTASMILAATPTERRHSHYDSNDNGNSDGEGSRPQSNGVKETIVEDDKESEASTMGGREFIIGDGERGVDEQCGTDDGGRAEAQTAGNYGPQRDEEKVFSISRDVDNNAVDDACRQTLATSHSVPLWDRDTSSTQTLKDPRLNKTLNFKEKVQFFFASDDFVGKDPNVGQNSPDQINSSVAAASLSSTKQAGAQQKEAKAGRNNPSIVISEEDFPAVKHRRRRRIAPFGTKKAANCVSHTQTHSEPSDTETSASNDAARTGVNYLKVPESNYSRVQSQNNTPKTCFSKISDSASNGLMETNENRQLSAEEVAFHLKIHDAAQGIADDLSVTSRDEKTSSAGSVSDGSVDTDCLVRRQSQVQARRPARQEFQLDSLDKETAGEPNVGLRSEVWHEKNKDKNPFLTTMAPSNSSLEVLKGNGPAQNVQPQVLQDQSFVNAAFEND